MIVSFIVVARNAGDKLINLISDIKKQDYNHGKIEIILVDGNSDDNTKQIMEDFVQSNHDFARVSLLENPFRILPSGWNIALNESIGDVVIRVDAHSSIPENFIRKNVEWIEHGEKIVGGHRLSVADSDDVWQKTLLIAETSLFGSGVASYRRVQRKKYVSTLAHAAYSREVFQKVGGYDERLARTEDNEIHYRMKKAGYKFFYDPEIKSYHHVRNTFSKMLKQKFLNGYWIGLTLCVSPYCFSKYHFIPLLFVLGLTSVVLLAINGLFIPLLILLGSYFLFAIANVTISIKSKKFIVQYLFLPIMFFLLHYYYGIGTIIGIVSIPCWRVSKSFELKKGAEKLWGID